MFDILPMKSNYTLSHIPISSMAYMQILSDCKLVKYKGTEGAANLDHGKLWAKYFNLKAIETPDRIKRLKLLRASVYEASPEVCHWPAASLLSTAANPLFAVAVG